MLKRKGSKVQAKLERNTSSSSLSAMTISHPITSPLTSTSASAPSSSVVATLNPTASQAQSHSPAVSPVVSRPPPKTPPPPPPPTPPSIPTISFSLPATSDSNRSTGSTTDSLSESEGSGSGIVPSPSLEGENSPMPMPKRLAAFTMSTASATLNLEGLDPALTGLAKMLAMRGKLCMEVRDTEYSYLTSLRTAIQSFLTPIKDKVGKTDEILNQEELNVIFSNVTEIEDYSASLWKELAARCKVMDEKSCFCDIFLKYFDKGFTNSYVNYINQYDGAIAEIEKRFKSKKDKFTVFIKAVEEKEKDQSYFKNLSFTSFLITPVQRIPRYVLLLRDMLKNTPEDHPDYMNVTIALEKVSKIASLINEKKREDEQLKKMQEFVEHFENKEEIAPLNLATIGRFYVAEGPIYELLPNGDKELRTLVVLSDMFICTTKRKDKYTYKWKINLLNCKVEEKEENESKRFKIAELKKIPEHPYIIEESILLAPVKDSPATPEFWLKAFNTANASFWKDQKMRIIQNAQEMKKYMTEHILTEKDWRLLQSSMITLTLKKDDVIIKEGEVFRNLNWIEKGTVRVQKKIGNEVVVFARIEKNEFFGEMAYLKKKEQKIGASVVADCDDTVIQKIPEDKLDTLLLAHHEMGERFFKLLCYILAARFVERPMEAALKKKTKAEEEEEEEAKEEKEKEEKEEKEEKASDKADKEKKAKKEEKKLKEGKKPEDKKLKSLLSTLKLPSNETKLEEFEVKLKDKKQHGQLYVFQKHIGFYSKIFGRKTILVFQSATITDLVREGTNLLSITANRKLHTFSFENTAIRDQAEAIIKNQLGGAVAMKRDASLLLDPSKGHSAVRNDALKLQPKDWEEILYGCATTVSCKADEPILKQGDIQQRLYQVVDGVCRVELVKDGETVIVGSIKKGEVFGELSFVLGGIASASVVADKGVVKVVFFERSKLDALFLQKPKLGAGFYFYLARQIRNRLMENQKKAAASNK